MALICIGSVCFSLFHIGVIILLIINYFSSHIKKIFPSFFKNPNKEEIDKHIGNILEAKRKNKQLVTKYLYRIKKHWKFKPGIFINPKFFHSHQIWCRLNQLNYYYVTLVDIDVDIHPKLNDQHNIKALPTFEFYFNLNNEWVLVHTVEGANQNDIEKAFQKYCLEKAK
ncbi:thioredoxin 3 [Plasmodium falciparum RAJ116]|uniref:Thioredoxin 3 n=1 Tax=Plasmodium falciparum RAJ116 TaxID=580058 RepID=A0A0L0CXG2_PLAFA|nr:thioredoxin 3 [Plasmodium falciparum RAJ116]